MADAQNYPSPTEALQVGNGGPFYGRMGHHEHSPPPQHEIPDDLQLRADLARSLAPPLTQDEEDDAQLANELLQDAQFVDHLSRNSLGIHDASPVDQISPEAAAKRKDQRQKVSKACDECRRKKIRCDAPSENGTESCANCKRTNTQCLYTRQQMKRGPSKGYIKELADRLNNLENVTRLQNMQQQQELQSQPQGFMADTVPIQQHFDESPPPVLPSNATTIGQKRTFEVMNRQLDQQLFRQSPVERPAQPITLPSTLDEQTPQPVNRGFQPFFKYGADNFRRDTSGTPLESGPVDGPAISDWDEEVVDEYYALIHQTFPLLPHSKNNLRIRLSACPAGLREAFITVLGCMMRTFPSSNLRASQSYAANLKRAAGLLATYPFDNPSSHTNSTDLVYLQTLLLMALESDNHGPATMRGQAGPSRAEWLGRAAGVAGSLELNLVRPKQQMPSEGDPDSEERLARRVWWVLFILDRWHASSTADLLKLPENSVVLLPEDQILLGESSYHLARLSFIIGHLASILTTTKTPETNVMAPSNPASHLLGLTLAGEIDRFRESVESVWGSLNLVHLSYHHSHLLIKRLNPTTEPTELIGHALKVATVLNQRQTPITPLNHHFAALSAMTLCELADVTRTRADAHRGLDHLAEALGAGRGLSGHPSESTGWDSAIRELVKAKRARIAEQGGVGGNAAGVGGEGNVAATALGGGKGFDPTRLTMYGYLTALGQGMFQT